MVCRGVQHLNHFSFKLNISQGLKANFIKPIDRKVELACEEVGTRILADDLTKNILFVFLAQEDVF